MLVKAVQLRVTALAIESEIPSAHPKTGAISIETRSAHTMILSMQAEPSGGVFVWVEAFLCMISSLALLLLLVKLHQRVWATYDLLDGEFWEQQTVGKASHHTLDFGQRWTQ